MSGPRTRDVAQDVPAGFDDVARRYDLLVALSPGYHGQLRSSARVLAQAIAERREADGTGDATPAVPAVVVDLGCGSGASTNALAREFSRAGVPVRIVAVDGSAGMLAAARAKSWPPDVEFVQGRAEDLAAVGVADGSVDGVFAAYLVRNVPDKDALLADIARLLTPGGTLVVHDYVVAGDPVATASWHALCWGAVVPTALAVTRSAGLFVYLWRSVLAFDSVPGLIARLEAAGYEGVRHRGVPGWQGRMVHTFRARRGDS